MSSTWVPVLALLIAVTAAPPARATAGDVALAEGTAPEGSAAAADGGTPAAQKDPDAKAGKSALEEMMEEDEADEAKKGSDRTDAVEEGHDDPSAAAGKVGSAARPEGTGPKKARKVGEVSDEVQLGSSQATPQNPRQGQLSNALHGSIFASDSFTVNAGVTLTFEQGSPPAQGSAFAASYGGTIALLTGGIDWDPGEHYSLGAHLDFSPSSQQLSTTQVSFADVKTGKTDTTNALLHTDSSSFAVGVSAGYDTAGESDFESAVTLGVTGTNLSSDERIREVQGKNGAVLSADDVRKFCAKAAKNCSRSLRAVLHEDSFSLLQTRLSAAYTATVGLDTDLTLSGDYYLYSDDPTKLGFFSVATAGRLSVLGGGGVPIAPMLFSLRPEVAHRFGEHFSARLWIQGGEYVDGGGQGTTSIGTKLQYKFNRSFKLWLTASGQRDVDVDGNVSQTGMLGLGAAYKF